MRLVWLESVFEITPGEFVTVRRSSPAVGAVGALAVALLLSGCTLAERIGAEGSGSPSAPSTAASSTGASSSAVATPATPAPTTFPIADALEGDALVCQDANAATDAMFSLSADGASYDGDADKQAQFTAAVDQLLAARDAEKADPEVKKAISDLVFTFTGRASDRDDWLIWDAARTHAADPDSGTVDDALDDADDACDDVGYDWVDWEPRT